jgi:hypothetical protein
MSESTCRLRCGVGDHRLAAAPTFGLLSAQPAAGIPYLGFLGIGAVPGWRSSSPTSRRSSRGEPREPPTRRHGVPCLGAHTSRRGFLRRMAMAGSAVVTAPMAYALRPITAYQAIVLPNDCPPGSQCRSGWTEFCCTSTGTNTCPPGSVVGGWWRAEGSGYCNGNSRYYMDCHTESCGGCGCGASGPVATSASTATVTANSTDATCGRPAAPASGTASATSTSNASDRSCAGSSPASRRGSGIRPARPSTPATTPPPVTTPPASTHRSARTWRDPEWSGRTPGCSGTRSTTATQPAVRLGTAGDVPLMADWLGSGVATAAVVRGARHGTIGRDTRLTWYLRQIEGCGPARTSSSTTANRATSPSQATGSATASTRRVWCAATSGCCATATRPAPPTSPSRSVSRETSPWSVTGRQRPRRDRRRAWHPMAASQHGHARSPDHEFDFGSSTGIPVVGDWNGNGVDSPGRFENGLVVPVQLLQDGSIDVQFTFGTAGDTPVVWRRR